MARVVHREPKPGRCNAVEQVDGGPSYCWRAKCRGRERCKRHGGMNKRGMDHHRFKHGLRSRFIKEQAKELAEGYQAALSDASLTAIDTDLATVELLIRLHTTALKDRIPTKKERETILTLVEQRRKLLDTQVRMSAQAGTMVPIDKVRNLARAFVRTAREIISDPQQQRAFQARFAVLARGLNVEPEQGQVVQSST